MARLDAADIAVLKVQPLGGVAACLRIAEQIGLPVVVSSALETSVGIAAGVALAAALPELPYACGLATLQLLDRRRDLGALAGRSTASSPSRRAGARPRRRGRGGRPGRPADRWPTPARRAVRGAAGGSRAVNPSTALATVLVDELVRGGVREAVLCPGSRNAPLAFALHDADRDGRLRLHVRIDERTAGFLALGLAKASGLPVPVVTTSGTAAVNLHPAVVEADYSRVPLVVLTADRPAELRGTGANQTIDQVKLFGGSVRWFHELSADAGHVGGRLARRGATARSPTGGPGPVHLNVALREPLVPDAGPVLAGAAGRRDRAPRRGAPTGDSGYPDLAAGGRTVVVAGDQALADARGLAEAGGWPLLAEPSSGHRAGPNALGCLPAAARPPR